MSVCPLGHVSVERKILVCINVRSWEVSQDRVLTSASSSQQSPAHLRFLWKMAVITLLLYLLSRAQNVLIVSALCKSVRVWYG